MIRREHVVTGRRLMDNASRVDIRKKNKMTRKFSTRNGHKKFESSFETMETFYSITCDIFFIFN